MKKNYAKTKLIIIAIFVIIGLCLTVLSFDIPGTSDKFLGFIGAMDKSTDLGNPYKVVFTVDTTEDVGNTEINKSIDIMEDIFTNYMPGYSDVKITRARTLTDEQIIAYVPQKTLNSSFFSVFESKKTLEVKTSNGAVIITNDNIEVAQYSQNNGSYGVYLKLDSKGTSNLMKYSDDLNVTIDGETATGEVVNNLLFVSNSTMKTANDASNATIALVAGKLPISVKVSSAIITAQSGEKAKTALIVATIVIAVCYVVYMIFAHRLLGLISLMSAGIYVVLYTFVIQSTSTSSLGLASYFAMIIAFVIYALANEYMISKMADSYSRGEGVRDIEISVEHGYHNALHTIIDIHVVSLILVLSMLIIGGRTFGSVTFNIIIGIIISAILTMLVNKFTIGLFAKIYSENNKVFNFKRRV